MAEILHFSWLHGGNKGLNEVFVLSEDSEDRSMRPSWSFNSVARVWSYPDVQRPLQEVDGEDRHRGGQHQLPGATSWHIINLCWGHWCCRWVNRHVCLTCFFNYRARLKGASLVALILFLALPGCSLSNSHAFLPISVHVSRLLLRREAKGI